MARSALVLAALRFRLVRDALSSDLAGFEVKFAYAFSFGFAVAAWFRCFLPIRLTKAKTGLRKSAQPITFTLVFSIGNTEWLRKKYLSLLWTTCGYKN
jgi:hypothetical protein